MLVGDVHAGCQLLVWRPEKQCLVLVSKHGGTASAFACEFLLHDEGALHLLLAEEGPTLRLMNYSRQLPESRRGTMLVPRAAFHIGAPITRMQRITVASANAATAALRPRAGIGVNANAAGSTFGGLGGGGGGNGGNGGSRRHAMLWASADGALGYVVPVEEGAFRRLGFLATKMVVGMPHVGGLNPRSFRAARTGATSARELKNLVDGQLVMRFIEASGEEQRRLAMQIGSTPRKVREALEELTSGVG